jgi:LAO/AO transport system kinase
MTQRLRYGGQELARLLSRIEAEDPVALGAAVRSEAESTHTSHVVGLTGPPGVGKSTLTGALIKAARAQGRTVAVLAVDPSSATSGGAVLGDRVRMVGRAPDPGVFIRSMATRGRLGGLSTTAPVAVAALAGAQYDLVIVGAVGSGQNEIDIAEVVDTVVVVTAPGMGDAIQALKAGLLEIADAFVVNKADRGGAGQTESQLRSMLAAGRPSDPSAWEPQITRAVAVREDGVEDLLVVLDGHDRWLGHGKRRRRCREERLLQVVRGVTVRRVSELLTDGDVDAAARVLAEGVASGRVGVTEAAHQLLCRMSGVSARDSGVSVP